LIEPEDEGDLEPGMVGGGSTVVAGLRASFLASPWASLDPVRVEAPFVLAVGGHLVRGRIDAAYERDGRTELVDFKTGRVAAEGDPAAATQLDLYGLAAIDAWGADPARLRTTYCYLRADGPPLLVESDWDSGTVDVVRTRLAAQLDALSAGRFGATAGAWCEGCDFLSFCPEGQAAQPAPAAAD
jgi:RecB family exonuclease